MAGRLSGMTAVVTAAAAGIGEATALAFMREGARVIATDIDAAGLATLQDAAKRVSAENGGTLATALLDATDAEAIAGFADATGAIDILFNCAGFVHHGSILDATEADWDFAFTLNVRSMFRMSRAFLPAMIAQGGGSIINISSIASSVRGLPNRFVYGASKAAVIGLTKSIAADFIKHGVRCNAICPGTVESPSLEKRIAAFADPMQARKDFIARQPMGRLGRAEEIAAVAVYLASAESAFTTGTTLHPDGGMTL